MSAKVIGLGYLSSGAENVEAWRDFAVEVLGAEITEDRPERLRIRLDDRSWRIEIRQADHGSVDVIGWEVQSKADLDELAELLPNQGYPVKVAAADEALDRGVTGLFSFTDTAGMTVEIFYGPQRPRDNFRSPLGTTYVTDTMGLGHVAQWVPDTEEQRRLYMDLLGFRLSDYIDFGPVSAIFLHSNRRHHSMAVIPQPGDQSKVSHLMLQVADFDSVGHALDRVAEGKAGLHTGLGKHTNDEMVSFYLRTPSSWNIEYGFGGLEIDDETWTPVRWDEAHVWGGHHPDDEHVAV